MAQSKREVSGADLLLSPIPTNEGSLSERVFDVMRDRLDRWMKSNIFMRIADRTLSGYRIVTGSRGEGVTIYLSSFKGISRKDGDCPVEIDDVRCAVIQSEREFNDRVNEEKLWGVTKDGQWILVRVTCKEEASSPSTYTFSISKIDIAYFSDPKDLFEIGRVARNPDSMLHRMSNPVREFVVWHKRLASDGEDLLERDERESDLSERLANRFTSWFR